MGALRDGLEGWLVLICFVQGLAWGRAGGRDAARRWRADMGDVDLAGEVLS